jgi:hypothetical protein
MARLGTIWEDEELARLKGVSVEIRDLPGTLLGLASSTVIWIDVDAAGHGWFIDPTPSEDSEFDAGLGGGDVVDRVDLLTVLAHEFMHILDQEHSHSDDDTGDLMDWLLPRGVRRIRGRNL